MQKSRDTFTLYLFLFVACLPVADQKAQATPGEIYVSIIIISAVMHEPT